MQSGANQQTDSNSTEDIPGSPGAWTPWGRGCFLRCLRKKAAWALPMEPASLFAPGLVPCKADLQGRLLWLQDQITAVSVSSSVKVSGEISLLEN